MNIYNPTEGKHGDLKRVRKHTCFPDPELTTRIAREIDAYFIDNPDSHLILLGHSAGTIHILNYLVTCPQIHRERIIYIAVAPAQFCPDGVVLKVLHLLRSRDPVPMWAKLNWSRTYLMVHGETGAEVASMVFGRHSPPKPNIVTVPAHPEDKGWDVHALLSSTYRQPLKGIITSIKERHEGNEIAEP